MDSMEELAIGWTWFHKDACIDKCRTVWRSTYSPFSDLITTNCLIPFLDWCLLIILIQKGKGPSTFRTRLSLTNGRLNSTAGNWKWIFRRIKKKLDLLSFFIFPIYYFIYLLILYSLVVLFHICFTVTSLLYSHILRCYLTSTSCNGWSRWTKETVHVLRGTFRNICSMDRIESF